MTDKDSSPHLAALLELESALDAHRRTQAGAGAFPRADAAKRPRRRAWISRLWGLRKPGWRLPFNPWFMFDRGHPVVRRTTITAIAVAAVLLIGGGALWWRLASGPIMLDLATPWLTSAIEQNLGSRYRVEVGGTQLERDEQGRTALRLRDIVLRDSFGVTVAIAPKAEVGISGTSLLMASPRAESFRLVDANMTVRIDPDGQTNVMVGGERPFVTIAPEREAQLNGAAGQTLADQTPARQSASSKAPQDSSRIFSLQAISGRSAATNVTALLAWIDELGKLGLDASTGGFDGHMLNEIGIANGSLTIDDRRSGTEWKLSQISLNLNRPKAGGVALTVLSESQERPWALSAALSPAPQGHRRLQLEARKVVLDDLLALRMAEIQAPFRYAGVGFDRCRRPADGTPQTISGSILRRAARSAIRTIPNIKSRSPAPSSGWIGITPGERCACRSRSPREPPASLCVPSSPRPRCPAATGMFALGGGWVVLDPLTA